ncbi:MULTISPECIES: S-layer homology domain-containing protein [Tissierellales]|jgi:flagellar biosynthesis/type III secretory pathway protein FliH|uniref:S-layer homology domain-containing protein n=1 Tax=Acidilutibacter cellobiosedens TaxID=2507161 RepID=A0A410QCJ4_9FIRM|nr:MULTISPECIES: S-layer homology domain-containing protein [Tissierellales]MBE6082577.1 S-layer homology domain-containing protein [Tissierellaceae bacterium]QAT61782.1 S-layer homology domain-containing protein [Acidilutibacter cellobiosedens]SCL82266.1 Endo-1,4-beta-xylanase A precursor [Sporanaerobacter sp. PP17-6a]
MKNKKSILVAVFFILFIFLFNGISYGDSADEENYTEARTKGYERGIADGREKALENKLKKIDDEYYKYLPSAASLKTKFKNILEDENDEYFLYFSQGYYEGFQVGYEEILKPDKKTDKSSDSQNADNTDGKDMGELLGKIYGIRDYYLGKKNNYYQSLPSNSVIISMFNLSLDSSSYRSAFINDFRTFFKEKYEESYREANLNNVKIFYENSYDYGKEIGMRNGEQAGTFDYYMGYADDPNDHYVSDLSIIQNFNLKMENEKYIDGFIDGYRDGFNEGYAKSYQTEENQNLSQSSLTKLISAKGEEVKSDNGKINVKIEKGTFYEDSILNINTNPRGNFSLPDNMIKGSEIVNIGLNNESGVFNDNSKVKISFEYYGDEKGGIYKLIDNNWIYIPSNIEEDSISALVSPSSIKGEGGIFRVLVDKNFSGLYDIRGHWARDEITTYIKRRYVFGYSDNTFKPDNPIRRGEFLIILSRVYDWHLPDDVENIEKFKDANSMKGYEKVIGYALDKGYIGGYNDDTFRPNNFITYEEIDNIMKKLMNTDGFKWRNIADKILYIKDTRSKSYNSMKSYISRGEVVYMLNIINEEKY